ncbi:MAG: archease [Chloroflexia bacterium]
MKEVQTPFYRPLEHTADLGLEVWASTLPQLYAAAAEGMCSLYFDLAAVQPLEQREVTARGHDREELLIDWLGNLLYGIEVERFLPCRFEVDDFKDSELHARVWGEPFDPSRHRWRTGIKAATYHNLHVRQTADGLWTVQIIFDT